MNPSVSIIKSHSYASAEDAVRRAVELLGGIDRFVRPGMKVLLKPNLLFGLPPERAVTTHPEVVRAVVKLVKQAGAHPVIGDSPIVGTGSLHARRAGFMGICREFAIPWVNFEDNAVEISGKSVFKKIEIARSAIEADAIINLPKLKTHGQTYLTMSVKNMFGIVPGVRKSRWHLSAGRDALQFAKVLSEICYLKPPVLNIVDGIIVMDGNGPRNGNPYHLGYIIAGDDTSATDRVICQLLRVKPEKVPTITAAKEMQLGETDLDNIQLLGDDPLEAEVGKFRFTGQEPPIGMGRFGFLVPLVKDGMTSRPWIDHVKCTLCNQCVEHCPAEVMGIAPDGKRGIERLGIDYDQCIRCYCCSEICPEGALSVRQGWMWKLVPSFLK